MKRRFVRRAVYPSSHNQWFRGKWPTPIKKTIYQHWRERFPFNLGCWLAPKLFFATMCFGKPLFSSTGKSWLVQWWEYLCPRARACRHHGRLRVPVLAGDRRTWRRSTQNKRRWRKCLFIRFAGAKAHCNNVGPFSNLQTLHVPVSKIWQPFISYFGFFYPKKVELNCWAHVFS